MASGDRKSGRELRKTADGNSGVGKTSRNADTTKSVKNSVKNTGVVVDFKGGVASTSPPSSFQLDNTLTEKEAKDMLPKLMKALETVFEYADTFITHTNRKTKEAKIWSSIDKEDLEILAEEMIDSAKRSKIVATATRKVVAAHRMLRVGLITLPRFIQTYKHYTKNGGFMLFPIPENEKVVEKNDR